MEFKNNKNIELVIELLKKNDISDIVISPGGTNIAFVRIMQDDPFFNCYSVVDERSAAYLAIGIYLQTHKPVVTLCTSAQATRNYVPGLTEAFYKHVPILALTMEKHPRFKYQEYMQAPDQTSLPNDCVKRSFELPFISDINDYYHSSRVVNEAILELTRDGMGPVQLCVPWLDFALTDIEPELKVIRRYNAKEIANDDLTNKRILLVIGEHIPFDEGEVKAINFFCKITNTAVYVNHLSNFSNNFTVEGNLFLLCSKISDLNETKPDIIITIGGQTGDYPFYLAYSKNDLSGIEHWRICDDGKVIDTYDKLTRIYQGKITEFFESVKSTCEKHSYYDLWKNKIAYINNELEVPFSNVSIAQFMCERMPNNSIIQFSILNCLRVWNMFHLDSTIECYSNVGAFGIDGGLSTLIGQSLVTDKLCFMVIGDLAFFYDMNSLSIRHIKNNLRILLINNNGGIEFKLHGENKEDIDKFISAADYHGLAKEWAVSCGFEYMSAQSMEEFIDKSNKFLMESDKPILFEAFVSDDDESVAYLKLVRENKPKTLIDTLKYVAKDMLGESVYKKLKSTIKG